MREIVSDAATRAELQRISVIKRTRERAKAVARLLWRCRGLPSGWEGVIDPAANLGGRFLLFARDHRKGRRRETRLDQFLALFKDLQAHYGRNKRWWREQNLAPELESHEKCSGFVDRLALLIRESEHWKAQCERRMLDAQQEEQRQREAYQAYLLEHTTLLKAKQAASSQPAPQQTPISPQGTSTDDLTIDILSKKRKLTRDQRLKHRVQLREISRLLTDRTTENVEKAHQMMTDILAQQKSPCHPAQRLPNST